MMTNDLRVCLVHRISREGTGRSHFCKCLVRRQVKVGWSQ
uniref:Uncharacterized protein n=1 Tax=Arundo donax TaxID=35708 RepID=A0A0A9A3Y5_ARUDO